MNSFSGNWCWDVCEICLSWQRPSCASFWVVITSREICDWELKLLLVVVCLARKRKAQPCAISKRLHKRMAQATESSTSGRPRRQNNH